MADMSKSHKSDRAIYKLIDRFKSDLKGVAAVEFAIIAPILILLFIGTLEMSLAVSVDRKVSRISSSVADLITQSDSFDADEIAKIMDISNRIMSPYYDEANPPSISIVGVEIRNDEAKVAWSCAKDGGESPAPNSDFSVPEQIRINDTFLVSAVVSIDHEPMVKFVGYSDGKLTFDESAIELSEQMFLRPRLGSGVEVENTGICQS